MTTIEKVRAIQSAFVVALLMLVGLVIWMSSESKVEAKRLRRQRDELAWRSIYMLTTSDETKRNKFGMELNDALNAIEDDEPGLYDWKNDPRYSDRQMDLGTHDQPEPTTKTDRGPNWVCHHDHVTSSVTVEGSVFQWRWHCDECGQNFEPMKESR